MQFCIYRDVKNYGMNTILEDLFFSSSINFDFLKKLSKECTKTKSNKDTLLKYSIDYKSKLLPLLNSLSNIDDQIFLLKIFYKFLPFHSVKKYKLFHPFTNDFLKINISTLEENCRNFLIAIYDDSSQVYGFLCDEIFYNGNNEKKDQMYCFFNSKDIKIYSKHIFYISFESIIEILLKNDFMEIIVKDKVFQLYMQIKDMSRFQKFINEKGIEHKMIIENKVDHIKTPKSIKKKENQNDEVTSYINVCNNIKLNVRGNIDISKTPESESLIPIIDTSVGIGGVIDINDESILPLKDVEIEYVDSCSIFSSTFHCVENNFSGSIINSDLKTISVGNTFYPKISKNIDDDTKIFELFSFSLEKSENRTKEHKKLRDKKKKKVHESNYEQEISRILELKKQLFNELSQIYLKEQEIKIRKYINSLSNDLKMLKKMGDEN